ncbi:hypothetical protein PRUPE_1G315300 [Prunus persica]|uniref:non-specific serine/threonine protein kinase n=1 Tax=Prunus persica TaxID=3760 RepID=A0A251R612_PRUPE|nr:hypothetical protein PRUPE_1G315300 [Prunus persica]
MFLLLTEASFALDFYYQNCSVPVSCGREDISYPFYIQGKQDPFCGYPGFQLSCHGDGEDAYPLLQLSGNNYTSHNIDYQRKSLISTACNNDISSLHNLTLPNDQFELASNQADFFLLYNCNSSVVESFPKYKVGCFDQATNKTRKVLSRGFDLNWFASDCSRCQDSGGRCGFNYTTYHFRCLCPRGTFSWRCGSYDKG